MHNFQRLCATAIRLMTFCVSIYSEAVVHSDAGRIEHLAQRIVAALETVAVESGSAEDGIVVDERHFRSA